MKVYLDNAATTPLDPQVFEAMKPMFLEYYGNPSSVHNHGRQVRAAVEKARRTIADLLNASPGEIFFTSGGTEADNMAIRSCVKSYGIKTAVSVSIEHHAVLHSLDYIERTKGVEVTYLNIDEQGVIDYNQLEAYLKNNPNSLVSIMHGNNELGNINDIERIAKMCRENGAFFHSDTVQTMGHYRHDVKALGIDFLVGSAHKFHGPKGIGFIYINGDRKIDPLLYGGSQERLMRAGTENVAGIVGLAAALEIAYSEMDAHHAHIEALKQRMITGLKERISDVRFNGLSEDLENSLYTVLSVSFPSSDLNEMLLFNMDINGISASGGSACTSGSNAGSHVMNEIKADPNRPCVRFSFSKSTTEAEVDYTIEKMAEMYARVTA